ncbi:MAG: hypothetical protein ABFR63_05365 [Thermodesulfobacteriota bacterium]
MTIWQFSHVKDTVRYGTKRRRSLTGTGCNEPFKGRFWCPRKRWFAKDPCPFLNRRECHNFDCMCGRRLSAPTKNGEAII